MDWTQKEEQYIKDNYKTQSTREMAEYLERSRPSVKGKCERLKLVRTKNDVGYLISKGMRQLFKSNGKYWNRTLKNGIKYSKSTRRLFLLEDLGGKCVLCGMDDIDTLQFDHINNDGYLHNNSILQQVESNPEKFQILCANCNIKKEVYKRAFDRLERLGVPPF